MTGHAGSRGAPPRRADARRNYEHVLATARAVFAEQGTQASLRDVARRAEVGLGTLYRHFPTRDALLEALLRDAFDRLVDRAQTLAAEGPPRVALERWLRELARGATTYRGLPASMVATLQDPESSLYSSCIAVHNAGARLLEDAQKDGTIRTDVTGTELFALVGALATMSEQPTATPERRDVLLSVFVDGLRTERATT